MISVSTLGRTGYGHAECSDCGWQCTGPVSESFTRAVIGHTRTHRLAVFGPVAAGLVSPGGAS